MYPIWPWVEKCFFFLRKRERQPYHIGWLAPGKTLGDLKDHLSRQWGFGNHAVALTDPGQVLSWRKLVSFKQQYHIRVFKDGEVRGHFEFTPEAKPIGHFIQEGMEERTADLKRFLGDTITAKEVRSELVKTKTFEQIGFSPSRHPKVVTYKVPAVLALGRR